MKAWVKNVMREDLRVFISLGMILALIHCSGRGDVDLTKAKKLGAEPVSSGPGAAAEPTAPQHGLFTFNPGQWTTFRVAGGAIDPVGTTLAQDFDGDGIDNTKERTSNIWVADYPVIETEIAPPVTMKIEILKNFDQKEDEVASNITSDDFESRKNEGSEKFHQDEVNAKTVQYERAIKNDASSSSSSSSSTSSASVSASASASGGSGPLGLGSAEVKISATVNLTSNTTNDNNYSFNNSASERTQVFEDRPFKNNIDRTAGSVKADSAGKSARQYRQEKRQKTQGVETIKPDAGVVRAALYIKNHSVNMPVRLSNILCSLVFETGKGELIPMQSFRLRNDDFSLFEVEVYGSTDFGPYVVELKNLNTVEVEKAINAGYTPKIFIVDYVMQHVTDSNYRTALSSNFTGDNLKIIEENSKGRTALVKIFAPNYREMFRIVAFDAKLKSGQSNICDPAAIDNTPDGKIKPGISLRAMLERLKCSGISVEFEHVIYDFSGTSLAPKAPMVYTFGIKAINGRDSTQKCHERRSGVGINLLSPTGIGPVSDVCVVKLNQLSDDEAFNLNMWTIFDNGKYFQQTEYLRDGSGNVVTFNSESINNCGKAGVVCGIPVLRGIESTVWAGDNFDIVFMKVADVIGRVRSHGTNPLETNDNLKFNTAWSMADTGPYPDYPGVKSIYLGQATKGDLIEVKIKLNDTFYLDPKFTTATSNGLGALSTDFSYNRKKETQKLFSVTEAVDFELNLGLGGDRNNWYHLIRDPKNAPAPDQIGSCGQSWNFLQQEYTFCLILPIAPAGIGPDGILNLHLRSALSNAYRRSIWPQDWRKIKKFEATVQSVATTNNFTLMVNNVLGSASDVQAGDTMDVTYHDLNGDTSTFVSSHTVNSIVEAAPGSGNYTITVTGNLNTPGTVKIGGKIYVNPAPGSISSAPLQLFTDQAFESSWNSRYTSPYPQTGFGSLLVGNYDTNNCSSPAAFRTTTCLGYSLGKEVVNWIGFESASNNFVDETAFKNDQMRTFMEYRANGNGSLENRYFSAAANSFVYNSSEATLVPSAGIFNAWYEKGARSTLKTENYTVILWTTQSQPTSSQHVRGKIWSNKTGQVIVNDFIVSEYGLGSVLVDAVATNDLVAVIYRDSSVGLKCVVLDLNKDVRTQGNFLYIPSFPQAGTGVKFAASQDKLIMAWSEYVYPTSNGTNSFFKVINLKTGVSSSAFPLLSLTGVYWAIEWTISASGDRAVLVRAPLQPVTPTGPQVQIVNLSGSTGAPIGSVFSIPSDLFLNAYSPAVSVSGDRALVTWGVGNGPVSTYKIKGALLDVRTGSIGSTIDFGNSDYPNYPLPPKVVLRGSRALVIWPKVYDYGANVQDIFLGRILDADNGAFITSAFEINDASTRLYAQESASDAYDITVSGDRALITWRRNGAYSGRMLDLVTGSLYPTFNILPNNGGSPKVQTAFSGNKAFITYLHSSGLIGRTLDFDPFATVPYGLNNFFTAPLIERNYTATARIIK